MRYKYQLDLGVEIGRPSVRGRPVVTAADFERLGCGVFAVETRHGRIRDTRSDRLYLMLEGEGRFTIEDESLVKLYADYARGAAQGTLPPGRATSAFDTEASPLAERPLPPPGLRASTPEREAV
jgi:hypothetical protein